MWWLLPVIGGAALAFQTGANASMAASLQSALSSACLSFVTGAFVLGIVVMMSGAPGFSRAMQAPVWTWMGGISGATYVACVAAAAPQLGGAATVALVLAGQLLTAVMLDSYGLAGFTVHAITLPRVFGILFILGGVVLVRLF